MLKQLQIHVVFNIKKKFNKKITPQSLINIYNSYI